MRRPGAGKPPRVVGILETGIYVDDLKAAHSFYGAALGLHRVLDTPRMMTYAVAPGQVLLVFRRGATRDDIATAGGLVPGHHSDGHAHFAFAVETAALEDWKEHLASQGIEVTSEVVWPEGGRSIYFKDPDGNVVEMATPGLWPNY